MKYFVMLCVCCSPVSHVQANTFLYISLGGEKQISCFKSDSESGKLKPIGKIATTGAPGAMAVDASQTYLFVALRSTQGVGTYKIDSATGQLSHVATQTVGVNPVYLTVNPGRSHLLLASYSAGKVASFPLSEEGKLTTQQAQWFDTEKKAHSILLHPSHKFGYVPHTGPNAMYQFTWKQKQGQLAFNSQKKVTAPAGTGPRHLAFHPNGKFVYTSDEQGSSCTVYSVNPQSGQLSALQTLSTLPDNFGAKNSCADIEIHPSAQFLYVSNRGHDSIALFTIDQSTGLIKSSGQTATEQTPRSFNLTPDGQFIYAAGQKSGRLACYRVDQQRGTLSQLHVQKVGKSPSWVQTVSTK